MSTSSPTRGSHGKPAFLDFFAGAGLATEGLRRYFKPVWANDISPKKASVFLANHPKRIFRLSPIEEVRGWEVPPAELSWASFPCQDLSLAGNAGGIEGERSGLVWQWLRVMDEMPSRPPIVVAENVLGLVSTDGGAHYLRLHAALVERGYKVGAMLIDAAHWVPQSRPRVFVVGVSGDVDIAGLASDEPGWQHPAPIQKVAGRVRDWVWWRLPKPPRRRIDIEDVVDFDAPVDEEPKRLRNLSLIPEDHYRRLEDALKSGRRVFPGYRRRRNGRQVLELRFDGLAGALRTPTGGSSRQILVIEREGELHTRLLTIREAAALMGLRASYRIPGSYNDGYWAMGDAVVVPVVRHLARHLLSKLAARAAERKEEWEILERV